MSTKDTPHVLVTISSCTATHILGSTTIPLASGTLSLLKSSTDLAAPSLAQAAATDIKESPTSNPTPVLSTVPAQSNPVLTLQIGSLAFPLFKDTLFGTDSSNPLFYLFAPELGPAGQASQGGYVRLELPEEARTDRSDAARKQEQFEKVFIDEGLLKEGWESIGDGIRKSVDNSSTNATSLSPTAQSFLEASAKAGQSVSNTTSSVATSAAQTVTNAGKWLADTISNSLSAEGGGIPAEAIEEDPEDQRNMTRDVVEGAKAAAQGTSDLARSASKNVGIGRRENSTEEATFV